MWPRGHTLRATAGMPPADIRPPSRDITGEAVAKLKQAPRALAPELVRASCVWQEYYVISIESEDVNMRIRKNILMTLAIMLDKRELRGRLNAKDFAAADPDNDGTLDKNEFLALVEKRFNAANPDNDGTLDAKELKTAAGRSLARLLK